MPDVTYVPDPNLDPLIRMLSQYLQAMWQAPANPYPGALSPAFNPMMGQASSMARGLASSPYGMGMNPAAMGATNVFSQFANSGYAPMNPYASRGQNPYLAGLFGGGRPNTGTGGVNPATGASWNAMVQGPQGGGGGMGPWGIGLMPPPGGFGPPPNMPQGGGYGPPNMPPVYRWVWDETQKKYVPIPYNEGWEDDSGGGE